MSGRRYGNGPRFKGPGMKSWHTQTGPGTRMEFRAGAQSTRQQVRNLKRKCRHILDSRDPRVVEVANRVLATVRDEPNPEFGCLHLVATAIDRLDDVADKPEQLIKLWPDAMTYILDEFERMNNGEAERVEMGRAEKALT